MLSLAFTLGKVSTSLLPRSVYATGDLLLYFSGDVSSGSFIPEASSSVYVTGDLLVEFCNDDSAMLPSPARWTVTKGAWPFGDLFVEIYSGT
jgi:hypothetical protein